MSTTDNILGASKYNFSGSSSGLPKGYKNDKFFTLMNKKTGKIELKKDGPLGFDPIIGSFDPVTKKFTGDNPLLYRDLAKHYNTDEGRKQLENAARDGAIKEQVEGGVDPIVARKIANDVIKDGSTNVDPNDSNDVRRIIGEEKENLLDGIGRKKFGNYRYPEKMSKDQDAIKFALMEFSPRKFDSGTPGVLQDRERSVEEKQILGSVVLPIPGGIKDQNSVGWSSGDLNPAQALGAQSTISLLGGGQSEIGDIIKGVTETAGAKGIEDAAIKALAGAATGTSQQLIQRGEGAVLNPNVELLFNKPQLRSFNFTFNLSPRNIKESSEVKKIIRLFKQGMAVRKTQKGVFLKSPLIFQITYIKNANNLNRFKEAALTDFSVDYTPNGAYSTFRDGTMTQYKITMKYQELDPIFNSDYEDLDSEEAAAEGGYAGPFSTNDTAGIGF